jgi:hypothetical protein
MEFRAHEPRDASAIEHLFSSVFAEAEGKSEGTLIGTLARDLLAETVPHDLYGFVAVEQGASLARLSSVDCASRTIQRIDRPS